MFNKLIRHGFIFSVFTCFCVTVIGADTDKCYLNSKTKNNEQEEFLNKISSLFGQTFRTEVDGNKYAVAICSDISAQNANVSVMKTNRKGERLVLGKRNETYVDGGDTWILLNYNCGDKRPNGSDSQCLGHHSASIYVVCDPKEHKKFAGIKLVETDNCHYTFILPSINICKHEEEISGSTIFLIAMLVGFFMYFFVGIIYRRLAYNAQGCQQLPHFHFWQKIGTLLADVCSYICRCEEAQENSWNNINSNFDSGDRDDVLLRT